MDKGKDRRSYRQSGSGSGSGTKKTYLLFSFFFSSAYHNFTLDWGEGGFFFSILLLLPTKKDPYNMLSPKTHDCGSVVYLIRSDSGQWPFQKQFPSQILVFREQTLTGAIMGPFWVHSSFYWDKLHRFERWSRKVKRRTCMPCFSIELWSLGNITCIRFQSAVKFTFLIFLTMSYLSTRNLVSNWQTEQNKSW